MQSPCETITLRQAIQTKYRMAVPDNMNTTEIPALGRDCTLGMLYNQYNDQFVPSWTLWNQEKLQKDLVEIVSDAMESTCIGSDTLDKRAKALDLHGGLQISALSGLVNMRGSAKFLNKDSETMGVGSVAFKCRHITKCVSLTMEHLTPENIDHPEVFDKGIATHVVTQIQYGAQAFLDFSSDNRKSGTSRVREAGFDTGANVNTDDNPTAVEGKEVDTDPKPIQGNGDGVQQPNLTEPETNLAITRQQDRNTDNHNDNGGSELVVHPKASENNADDSDSKSDGVIDSLMKKLNFALNVDAGGQNNDINTNEMEKLQCQTFTDISQGSAPTTYKEAVEFCKQFPKALQENPEKARPLVVWLTPLSCLDRRSRAIQSGIENSLIEQCQHELQSLSKAEKRCQALLDNQVCKRFPGLNKECLQVQSYLQQYLEHFRLSLRKLLPKDGEPVKDLDGISAILETKKCSPFHEQILDSWFDQKEKEISFLTAMLKDKTKIFDMHECKDEPRIALVLHRLPLKENSFLQEMKTFCGSLIDNDQRQKWNMCLDRVLAFMQGSVVQDFEKTCESFRVCLLENYESPVSFVISEEETKADCNKSLKSAKLQMFLDGKWEPFQLPNKPEPPICKRRQHTGLNIEITPSKFQDRSSFDTTTYQIQLITNDNLLIPVECQASKGPCTFFVQDLAPSTTYHIKVRACTKYLKSNFSDQVSMETCKTSEPACLLAWQDNDKSIFIQWECPYFLPAGCTIDEYELEMCQAGQAGQPDRIWRKIDIQMNKTLMSCNVKVDSCGKFLFRIRAISQGNRSWYCTSNEVQVQELLNTVYKERMRDMSKKVVSGVNGTCDVHQLPLKMVMSDPQTHIRKYSVSIPPNMTMFGHARNRTIPDKVVLFAGQTGSGKSTMINFFINHLMGVQWNDPHRFRLVDETEELKTVRPFESQTQWITSYKIAHECGMTVPYNITIIDTPGFGDPKGLSRDQEITKQLQEFFKSRDETSIPHLNAVAFVIKASTNRLDPSQKYIYTSVLELFGKNIEENIFLFLPFAEPYQKPLAISAVEEYKIPYSAYYTFSNGNMFGAETMTADSSNDGDDVEFFEKKKWAMGAKGCKEFFTALSSSKSKTLEMTNDVTRYRRNLSSMIKAYTSEIKTGLEKFDALLKAQELFEKCEQKIDEGFKFSFHVIQTEKVKETCEKRNLNCLKCKLTCDEDCWAFLGLFAFLRYFSSMIKYDGTCKRCECSFWEHERAYAKYQEIKTVVNQTTEEVTEAYEKAYKKKMTAKQQLEKIRFDIQCCQANILVHVKNIITAKSELNEKALHSDPRSIVDYLDLLIHEEKQKQTVGWEERLRGLESVRKEAETLAQLSDQNKGVDAFQPFKDEINKLLAETEDPERKKSLLNMVEWLKNSRLNCFRSNADADADRQSVQGVSLSTGVIKSVSPYFPAPATHLNSGQMQKRSSRKLFGGASAVSDI